MRKPQTQTRPSDTEMEPLVEIEDLRVSFRTDEGLITPVDGVSFSVPRGKTLGIVGESGSGKSVSTKALMKLLPQTAIIDAGSRMRFTRKAGGVVDIARLGAGTREMRDIRGGDIAMIFQEPMASFSPVWTIGNQMIEAIRLHRAVGKAKAREIAIDMLERVGISNPDMRVDQYPHEMSGGMRQRCMIALALSTNPSLLIADEPTTALDVTIQAQILDLMNDIQSELDMSIIFITHDMGVIAHVADEVAVMYLGRIVERGPTAEVIHNPKHPYTKGLLAALPDLDHIDRRLVPVGGDIPGPMNRPAGCAFHPRCDQFTSGLCDAAIPHYTDTGDGREVSCFLVGQDEGAR
ncbi:MAG: ABC transporter ATP-binding protein [Pseudomonadota bacterium]